MAKKKDNYLDYVPNVNTKNTWDEKDGIVTINMVNSGFYNRLCQKLFHTPKVSRIDLDEYGSFVWKCIDGKASVYDIGQDLEKQFGDEAKPLYERLVKYMQILHNNRFVFFVGKGKQNRK